MTDPSRAVRNTFERGLCELAALLERHTFQRIDQKFGQGSGGPFAQATYGRDDRSITLWLRGGSLSVVYRCGAREADHLAYMREVAGVRGANEFPTFSDDAVESFSAVCRDLEAFGRDFLDGSCEQLCAASDAARAAAREGPMKRLADIEEALKAKRQH